MNNYEIMTDEYYSGSFILARGWFPWIKSNDTFRRLMKSEHGSILLKPVVRNAGKKIRYFIKGSTLLEIHKLAEEGKLEIKFNGKDKTNN